MAMEIQPGSTIKVTLTRTPTTEAAAKTLARVFRSSPEGRRARVQRRRLRTNQFLGRQRGGRIWTVRPKAPRLMQPEEGTTCEILATSSIIRDLASVERFVKVG